MVVTDETVMASMVCGTVLVLLEELLLQQSSRSPRQRARQLHIILSSSQGRLHGRELNLSSLNDLIAEAWRLIVSVEVGARSVLCHRLRHRHTFLRLRLLRPHSLIKGLQRRLSLLPESNLMRRYSNR